MTQYKKKEYPNLSPVKTNPNKAPYGRFTGRCPNCQSKDMWSDDSTYGCNNCGRWFPN